MIITYQGMNHRIIREFIYKGVEKIELKNLHNNNQFVINKQDPELILLSGNIAGSLKISYLGHEKYLNKDRFYSYFKSLIS